MTTSEATNPGQVGGRTARPSGTVSIVLNGEARSVAAGLTVAGLLGELDLEPGMVVVERNREILAREDIGAAAVEEGDRFELVHFVGGG